MEIDRLKLKHLREAERLSQEAVAEQIGISRESLNRIEKSGNAKKSNVLKLAEFFDITLNDLLGNENASHIHTPFWANIKINNKTLSRTGEFFQNFDVLLKRISQILDDFIWLRDWDDVGTVNFSECDNMCELEIRSNTSPDTCHIKFSMMRYEESSGFHWSRLSQWMRNQVYQQIEDLLREKTTQYSLNDHVYGVKSKFVLTQFFFRGFNATTPLEQFFSESFEGIEAAMLYLTDCLIADDKYGVIRLDILSKHNITYCYRLVETHQEMVIKLERVGEHNGEYIKAPFPKRWRDRVESYIDNCLVNNHKN